MPKVTVLARKGRSVLVEWLDDTQCPQRSYVPYDSVVEIDSQHFCELAEMGIPYGVPWELIAQQLPALDGTALQKELRRLGVWTVEDLQRNPEAATSAVRQVIGISLGQLLRKAAEYLQGATNE